MRTGLLLAIICLASCTRPPQRPAPALPLEAMPAAWKAQAAWSPAQLTQNLEIASRGPAGKGTVSGKLYFKAPDSLRLDFSNEMGITGATLFWNTPEIILVNHLEKKYYRGSLPGARLAQWLGLPLPGEELQEALLGLLHLSFPGQAPVPGMVPGSWTARVPAGTGYSTFFGSPGTGFPDSCAMLEGSGFLPFTKLFSRPQVMDCPLPLPGSVQWRWNDSTWLKISYDGRNLRPTLSPKTFLVKIPEGYLPYPDPEGKRP